MQDYYRRQAEVQSEYARNLEKLSKQISLRHKDNKQKSVMMMMTTTMVVVMIVMVMMHDAADDDDHYCYYYFDFTSLPFDVIFLCIE